MNNIARLAISMLALLSFPRTKGLEGKIFEKIPFPSPFVSLQNVSFESQVVSVSECAEKCRETPGCWWLSVTTTSLSMTCRGHTGAMTSNVYGISTADTSVWSMAWLERPCSSNAECDVPLSECFAGRCLCSPGYYYSHSTDSCVEACSESNLQSRFLTYTGYKIAGNNFVRVASNHTLEECLAFCLTYPTARTCDYYAMPKNFLPCTVQTVTRLDVTPGDWMASNKHTHHQRTCL